MSKIVMFDKNGTFIKLLIYLYYFSTIQVVIKICTQVCTKIRSYKKRYSIDKCFADFLAYENNFDLETIGCGLKN